MHVDGDLAHCSSIDADGKAQAASVGYDMVSAKDRKKRLEVEGSTDVEIIEVKPGQRLEPKS
ncbi:hypothetical protein [Streptomyces sp. NPDC095817]|uniref:hypothetical protein n=1 Tax=Streptomyces sp. NPDC095817 TaxID=3155082 RepID=UPI003320F68B